MDFGAEEAAVAIAVMVVVVVDSAVGEAAAIAVAVAGWTGAADEGRAGASSAGGGDI